jgi:hypothetical protein
VVEVITRAREAKGPFPGGKRVGSWGKKKEATNPAQWEGLKGIVGGLGIIYSF